MIHSLSVENFAIIEAVSIDFEPGFTVFSGETGAGKSLLVDAIQLALGGRADTDQVRSGHERAGIKMTVDSTGNATTGSQRIEIEREVLASGKSIARIDSKVMPVSALRELGRELVDLHGQHDHQALLNPETHAQSLDGFIGTASESLKLDLGAKWDHLSAAKRRLESMRSGRREWERRVDALRYQIEEIEQVQPQVGEFEQLELQISRLKNAELLAEAVGSALEALVDGELNAADLAAGAGKSLSQAVKMDGTLASVADTVSEATITLQEAAHTLRAYADEIEASPGLLDECQSRQDDLTRLRRKYGEDEAEVLAHLARCQAELSDLTEFSEDEESLAAEVDAKEEVAMAAAEALSGLRKHNVETFEASVAASLVKLSMPDARFEVSMVAAELTRDGIDRIEFFFSANAGEPVKPLAKIASGGEMSRVMLSIKTALAGKSGVPTLVFDEVDSGLSGQAAAAMASLLRGLGQHYQVLVISHLPQVCAGADHHFKIQKKTVGGRTLTEVVPLIGAAREEEVARLFAGDEITDASLAHARTLMQGA